MKALHIVITAASLALAGGVFAQGSGSGSTGGATGSAGGAAGSAGATGDAGGAGSAGGATAGGSGSMQGTLSQTEFQSHDQDGNGTLSQQEIDNIPEEQRRSVIALDVNGDGAISEQEATGNKG